MANIRRLTPAPPPPTYAWDLNTLVPKQETKKVAAEISRCQKDTEVGTLVIPLLQLQSAIETTQSLATLPSNDALSLESPQPKVAARITNKLNHFIEVGKTVRIKKPSLPRTRDIKGGNGMFKYKIPDDDSQSLVKSQSNIWTTAATATTSLYNFRPDLGVFTHSAEDQSLVESTSLPSPILIPSSNSSMFPQSPGGILSPQQPMVVYGMPMYLHLPLLQHLLPQLVTPISQENKRDTLKAKIKKQLQYYFSTENLCKDTYLRSLFDKSDGKLAVKALVEFNRLKVLTHDGKYVELVLEAAKEISILEVLEGNRHIRLKSWQKWIIP